MCVVFNLGLSVCMFFVFFFTLVCMCNGPRPVVFLRLLFVGICLSLLCVISLIAFYISMINVTCFVSETHGS